MGSRETGVRKDFYSDDCLLEVTHQLWSEIYLQGRGCLSGENLERHI